MKLAGIIIPFIVLAYAVQPLIAEVAQQRNLHDQGTESSCCKGEALETCACCTPENKEKPEAGDPSGAQEAQKDHDSRSCDNEQPCSGVCPCYQNGNVVNAIICCISEISIFGEEIEVCCTFSDSSSSNHLSTIWHPPTAS